MTEKEFKELVKAEIKLMHEGKICCICGAPIKGFGNNPDPVVTIEGTRCCDECNSNWVIPARIRRLVEKDDTK